MKKYDAQEVIDRIAAVATAVGEQAGVGAMETAGGIIGYLAENPRDLEPFMNGGIFELPLDWHERHSLTWHDSKGIVRHPADVRRARQVRDLIKTAATGVQ
ncbi:hypothetical protein [Sphingopyxis macrogoltabida]|uniref:Uncharacterized protein n=1 Tax=Sphingopyxis macrogoltabida TaxID=33050 RepID=A0AAC8Z0V2_SPHMC|nr:hypothetical protein [Sphingopyxis macrogoltabida]ALJ12622.1 hypothetical protein LH19_07060 [Sphingopyxis macrogoltabida]AMU89908.1 hypothetical protein ATM17_12765 [Sphingopyxis macrogoltabida]